MEGNANITGTLYLNGDFYGRGDVDFAGHLDVTNLTVLNNFSAGGNVLYVDSELGRVGIGTTSPLSILDIKQTSSAREYLTTYATSPTGYSRLRFAKSNEDVRMIKINLK